MVHNTASSPVLGLLLLLALSTIPYAAAQSVNGIPVNLNGVSLADRVCCTFQGSCPGGGGITGANVTLSCYSDNEGNLAAVGKATTNATGAFNITVAHLPNSITIFNLTQNCYVSIPLPTPGAADNCGFLAAPGRLSSNIAPVRFEATRDYGVIPVARVVLYRKILNPPPSV